MLMLFYPFRSQEGGLKDCGSYASMLLNDNVLKIVNRSKEIFDFDLVELVLQNYNNNIEHNQDAYEESDEEGLEYRGKEEPVLDPFTQKVHHFLNDDEINEHIKSLNKRQREIFDVVLD